MTHTLVIGGTRGIGSAVARRFAGAGGAVSVLGRTRPAEGGQVRYWQADVSDPGALVAALEAAIDANGPLANVVLLQRFRGDGDAWQGELDVSLTATKAVVEWAADRFEEGGGSIVLFSSIASRLVASEQPVGYHAAKAALRQMCRYYAVSLGPAGIRVNCVTPGAVAKDEAYLARPAVQRLRDRTPLRRIPTSEEIAAAVCALCGPDLAVMTGQEIVLDAGLSLLLPESLIRDLPEAES